MTFNDGWGSGHVIEYNEIHDTVRETSDHGPISSWGRGRYWCYEQNHGPFSHASGHHDGEKDFVFYNPEEDGYLNEFRLNYIHEEPSQHGEYWLRQMGIDLDDGSSHYHVHENLCVGLSITSQPWRWALGGEQYLCASQVDPVNFWGSYEHNNDRFTRNIIVPRLDATGKAGSAYKVGWSRA